MGKVLLSVHVLASIIFVGPVTVAVSLFPRYARAALAPDVAGAGSADRAAAVAMVLHRVSRVYAVLGLSVPVAGIALGAHLGVLGETWVVVSIALTVAAAALLATVLLPGQHDVTSAFRDGGAGGTAVRIRCRRSAATAGLFSLTWTVVVVLMVLRPGSTTGV